MMKRLFSSSNDPGRKKKEGIKKMLEEIDKVVRRTSPSMLDEQSVQSFHDDLNKAKDFILDVKELHSRQCKDLTSQIRGIENELEDRWKASRNNPKSPKWIPPISKNKTDGNGRISVTQVNEKAQSKDHKYGGNGSSDIAKVHGSVAPEREHVTAKYYDRNHTEDMLSAGKDVLKSYERDFEKPPTGYRTSTRISANFALSKPPAVNSSDFKIHSYRDGSPKIPTPLQPEYRGNVQESSDVDRKIQPPISMSSSSLTNIDHVRNQLDHYLKEDNDKTFIEQILNESFNEKRSENGSGYAKLSCLDAEKNVQKPTSDSYESKVTSPNVKVFFMQYDEHNRNKIEQQTKQSISTLQNPNKPIASSDSRHLAPSDRTEAKRVEQTQHNSENVHKLMYGSSSRPIEAKRPNCNAEREPTQYARRDHEHSSSYSAEPVQNAESISNSRPIEAERSNRSAEEDTNKYARRDHDHFSEPVQNVESISVSKPIAASDSRQLAPIDRTEAKHVEQTQRNLVHRSSQTSENVYNVELMYGSNSRPIQEKRSNRNAEQGTNQYARHEVQQVQNAESISDSLRSSYGNSPISNSDHARKLERNQVHEVPLNQNPPISYANVVSKQTSRHANPYLHRNQNNYSGQHSSRSANPNELSHRQFVEERENPNSILQNISHGERRPDQRFYQPHQHAHNNFGYNQYQNYRQYPPQHAHNNFGYNQYQNYRQYPPAAGYQKFAQQGTFYSQHPNHAHVCLAMDKEQWQEVEMSEEEEEEQQQPEKPKIITDEIHDMTGHFQNDDLKNNKDKMPKDEYMALIRSKAEKFEPQIAEAESFDFMEFFIIDENLNQFVTFLDGTYTRDSEELTKQKIEIITYIKGLQETLDEKRSD